MKSVSTLQSPLIRVGRVIYVFPELNVYAVEPRDGLIFAAGEPAYEWAIDVSSPACTSRVGVSDGSSYAPGAEVLIMSLDPSNPDVQQESGLGQTLYNFILGPSYYLPLQTSEVFSSLTLDNPFLDLYNNQARNAISKNIVSYQMYQDRSYGRPADSTAGDFIKNNMFGGQVRLTMMRAAIGASDGSKIQMSALDNSMDLIADRFSQQGQAVHNTEYPTWDFYNRVERYARTLNEGLGAQANTLLPETELGEYLYKPQFDDQQGIFRQVKIDGALVEGSYDMMVTPEKIYAGGSDVRRISVHDEPQFGLSAIHKTYDGSINIQGVKNVGLSRSAYVWAPRELDLEDNNLALNTLELNPPEADWSNKVNIEAPLRADYASLMRDARVADSLNRYLTQIQQKSDADVDLWESYTKKEIEDKYSENKDLIDTETKLKPLTDTEDAYETTPSVEIDDPLKDGDKLKLQALLSCIELDESGAVIIHDGYGSEIKMHRGHITIAPAVDIKLRPGRSIVSKVPKDVVIRARKYVELSSDQSDVLIKSQRDMKLLSGNGIQGGMLTIENRGTTPFKASTRESDTRSSGISIKSHNADLSITAPNIYAGLLADSDTSPKGRQGASKGVFTLDSGKGLMTMSGRQLVGTFSAGVAYIVNQASMMSVDSSGVILSGSSLGVACGSVNYGAPTVVPTYLEVTDEGIETKTLNTQGGNVTVKIDGDIRAKEAVLTGSVRTDTVVANTVSSTNGYFGNGSDTSGLRGGKGPGSLGGAAINVNTSSIVGVLKAAGVSLREAVLEESGFTGYGILYSGFFYQQDNKYDTKGLVEARYQRMLRKNGDNKVWQEGVDIAGAPTVTTPEGSTTTEPWPGIDVPTTIKTISDDGLSSETLGDFDEAYVINTEK